MLENDRKKVQKRITVLVVAMMALILMIIGRYAWLQLVQGSELAERMRYQVGQDYLVQIGRAHV